MNGRRQQLVAHCERLKFSGYSSVIAVSLREVVSVNLLIHKQLVLFNHLPKDVKDTKLLNIEEQQWIWAIDNL